MSSVIDKIKRASILWEMKEIPDLYNKMSGAKDSVENAINYVQALDALDKINGLPHAVRIVESQLLAAQEILAAYVDYLDQVQMGENVTPPQVVKQSSSMKLGATGKTYSPKTVSVTQAKKMNVPVDYEVLPKNGQCPEGYVLSPDKKKCVAKKNEQLDRRLGKIGELNVFRIVAQAPDERTAIDAVKWWTDKGVAADRDDANNIKVDEAYLDFWTRYCDEFFGAFPSVTPVDISQSLY